jgi:uncharacterized CHY-type Zn-finger protein
MEFDEKSLRKGIQFGLGSQGIWTPELEDVMFEEIKNQALSQHDVIKSVCDNCKDVQGMYLGMTCPKCNRSFRCVKQTVL